MRFESSEAFVGGGYRLNGEKPKLAVYFEGIRDAKSEKPDLLKIEPVFASKSYRDHAYEEAKKLWDYEYDEVKLKRCLEDEPSDYNFKYVKELRKAGLVMKNMNLFMLNDPEAAQGFNGFITQLGKFNDRYRKKGRVSTAEKVKDDLSGIGIAHSETRNNEEFINYCENKLAYMLRLFENQELPEDDFHQLRKDIRAFAQLMLVPAADNPDGPELWIFRSLDNLSGNFGKARNDLDKASEILQVDLKDKEKFLEVLPLLKKSLGLAKVAYASAY